MRLSRFFIDRPIFAAVLSIVVFIAGLIAMLTLPISEYPEVVPPSVVVRADLPRRQPAHAVRGRGDAARGADQRRREHALHVVARPRRTACSRSPSPSASAPTSTWRRCRCRTA